MRSIVVGLVLVTATSAGANPLPRPPEWERDSGLTLQLGAGAGGLATLVGDHSGRGSEGKALYLDGAIGVFVEPRLAVVLRGSLARPIGDSDVTATAIFVGPGFQVHNIDGGPLWETIAMGVTAAYEPSDGSMRCGLGESMRIGYRFDTGSEHTLGITVGYDLGKIGGGWLTTGTVAVTYLRR